MAEKKLKVKLNTYYYDINNSRNYERNETLIVEENKYGDYYHIWNNRKLDLIPKTICSVLN